MKKTTITTLTKKGQTTIPKEIREYLGIKPYDRIEFVIEDNTVEIKPLRTLEENFGRVKPKKRPENFQKIRKDFEKQLAQEQMKKIKS